MTDESLRRDIKKFGWVQMYITDTDHNRAPNFGYSIGFEEKYDHPEILTFGFSPSPFSRLITELARASRSV